MVSRKLMFFILLGGCELLRRPANEKLVKQTRGERAHTSVALHKPTFMDKDSWDYTFVCVCSLQSYIFPLGLSVVLTVDIQMHCLLL